MTKTITEAVADRIGGISPEVNERVITALVDRELTKRTEAILNGYDKLRTLENELKKIKPDLGGYFEEDGTEIKPMRYSKERFEERKKKTDQIEKLRAALDLAIDKGDMNKLYDIK